MIFSLNKMHANIVACLNEHYVTGRIIMFMICWYGSDIAKLNMKSVGFTGICIAVIEDKEKYMTDNFNKG